MQNDIICLPAPHVLNPHYFTGEDPFEPPGHAILWTSVCSCCDSVSTCVRANPAELCVYSGNFTVPCISHDELHTYTPPTQGLLWLLLNLRKSLLCPTFALSNEPLCKESVFPVCSGAEDR